MWPSSFFFGGGGLGPFKRNDYCFHPALILIAAPYRIVCVIVRECTVWFSEVTAQNSLSGCCV